MRFAFVELDTPRTLRPVPGLPNSSATVTFSLVRVAQWKVASIASIALVALSAACGSDFYSTGEITSVSATEVCARFANSREECFPSHLFDQSNSSLHCIRVHYEGESASPLSARFVGCDGASKPPST